MNNKGDIYSTDKSLFSELMEDNEELCTILNKNTKERKRVISEWLNDSINNLGSENSFVYFIYSELDSGKRIKSFILYKQDKGRLETTKLVNNEWKTYQDDDITSIFIDFVCSNYNFKGYGKIIMDKFLQNHYNDKTIITLSPIEGVKNWYGTKLIYKPVAFSGNRDYLYFTKNPELLKYFDTENSPVHRFNTHKT